jgi:hypothetical protein
MALKVGDWALGHFDSVHIAFLGCDMHQSAVAKTHFYGSDTVDLL